MRDMASASEFCLRSPNNKVHRVPFHLEHYIVRVSSLEQSNGQWLVYTNADKARLAGVCHGRRMEVVGGTLIFNLDMTDTGEEFIILKHDRGVLVVCVQLSPNKCTIESYHDYLESYRNLLSSPVPGERSVSGDETLSGRVPTGDEASFRYVRRAVEISESAALIKDDLAKHARGPGGASGIDAQETLKVWKAQPDWYSAFPTRQAEAGRHSSTLVINGTFVTPLRAVRKESVGSNLFTGAASVALSYLAGAIGGGAAGSLVASLLAGASKQLRMIDQPTTMSLSEAWAYLQRQTHPNRSAEFARLLMSFRANPFSIKAPELVFQEFVTAKCLVALGLSPDDLLKGMRDVRTQSGCSFNGLTAWADTPFHRLVGWRDQTAKPSGYQPDLIVLDLSRGRTLLLDAKFRRDPTGLLPASGVKDIQAYMHEYELPKAILAVPATSDDPTSESVEGMDFTVFGIAVTPQIDCSGLQLLSTQLEKAWNNHISTGMSLK
jgi:hypothetical protein